jgi:hypothetical protein
VRFTVETMLVPVSGFVLIVVLMITISLIVQRGARSKGDASTPKWGRGRHRRNSVALWRLILLAMAYGLALNTLQTLTSATAAGAVGLALGLFICAHPAANAVNILFFERDMLSHLSEWSVVRWLGLNLLVLLGGWIVIFLGLRRMVDRAALELLR